MQQRTLGQAKTPISALGYGAMSFSDFYGPTTTTSPMPFLIGVEILELPTSILLMCMAWVCRKNALVRI